MKTQTSLFIIVAVVYNKQNKIDLSNYIMKFKKIYPQNMKKEKKTRYKRFKISTFQSLSEVDINIREETI